MLLDTCSVSVRLKVALLFTVSVASISESLPSVSEPAEMTSDSVLSRL